MIATALATSQMQTEAFSFMGETKHIITLDPAMGAQIGSAIQGNTDGFFEQLSVSLPKIGPAFIALGKDFAISTQPIRAEIVKGTLAVATVITSAILIKHLSSKYINKYVFRPKLVDKQSDDSLFGRIKSLFHKPKNLRDYMVMNNELEANLNDIIEMTATIKRNGGQFENTLLHGAPGTGKTLFAELLAQQCGMRYRIISAANVSQFLADGTAVEELKNLFSEAHRSTKGTIIFFDEAEAFLGKRKNMHAAAQNALQEFLKQTGSPSQKIMVIAATNHPEMLDDAVLSRFGTTIHFPLPDVQARHDQLIMHIKSIFESPIGKKIDYQYLQNDAHIMDMAVRLEKCSGRTLQQCVNKIYQKTLATKNLTVDARLVNEVINRMLQNQVDLQKGAPAA